MTLYFSSVNKQSRMLVAKVFLFLLFLAELSNSKSDDVLLSKAGDAKDQCSSDDCDAGVALDCNAIFSAKPANRPERLVNLKDLLLDEVNVDWKDLDKMFFVESAGNNHLTTRQACSVESAIHQSGLEVFIVAMTAKVLNVTANNATCQMYNRYATMTALKTTTTTSTSRPRLFFVHVDIDKLFAGTPIEKLHKLGRLKRGDTKRHPIVHYSDAIRILLVHRFGGWYSDLDMVFLKKLSHWRNVIASDAKGNSKDPEDYGYKVCNAIYHFDAGHLLLNRSIEAFARVFDGTWGSAGPELLSRVLRGICKFGPDDKFFVKDVHTKERCDGVEILPPKTFHPFEWFYSSELWTLRTWPQWDEAFTDSHTVHFFHSSTNTKMKVMKKRFYGNSFPAYLPLAMTYCPISFESDRLF